MNTYERDMREIELAFGGSRDDDSADVIASCGHDATIGEDGEPLDLCDNCWNSACERQTQNRLQQHYDPR